MRETTTTRSWSRSASTQLINPEILKEAEKKRPNFNRDLQPQIGLRPKNPPRPWNTCELGYRFIPYFDLESRTWEHAKVGLTPEDLLHPREDDRAVQELLHADDLHHVKGGLSAILRQIPNVRIFMDSGVDWQVPGFKHHHSPDIAVFYNFKRNPNFTVARVKTWRLDTRFVLEVVSPKRRKVRANDIEHKVREYHLVGVPQYIVADVRYQRGPKRRIRLIDYRWTPDGFVSQELGEPQRVRLNLGDQIQVCLGTYQNGCHDALGLYDGVTNKLFPDIAETYQRLAEAKAVLTRAETAEALLQQRP